MTNQNVSFTWELGSWKQSKWRDMNFSIVHQFSSNVVMVCENTNNDWLANKTAQLSQGDPWPLQLWFGGEVDHSLSESDIDRRKMLDLHWSICPYIDIPWFSGAKSHVKHRRIECLRQNFEPSHHPNSDKEKKLRNQIFDPFMQCHVQHVPLRSRLQVLHWQISVPLRPGMLKTVDGEDWRRWETDHIIHIYYTDYTILVVVTPTIFLGVVFESPSISKYIQNSKQLCFTDPKATWYHPQVIPHILSHCNTPPALPRLHPERVPARPVDGYPPIFSDSMAKNLQNRRVLSLVFPNI